MHGPHHLLPEWLILARDSRGMTPLDLAKASGLAAARIREIEEGGLPATPDEVRHLARGTGYPLSSFLMPRDYEFTSPTCRRNITDEDLALAEEPQLRARLRRMVAGLPARRLREAHDMLLAVYQDEQRVQQHDGFGGAED